MVGSHATHNAALVRRHQKQRSDANAKSAANKFTQRQSHFERRREEAQVRQQQAGSASDIGRTVGDGLLTRSSSSATRGGDHGSGHRASAMEEVHETPNPFARHHRASGAGAASGAFAATTRNATMGLERAVRTTRSIRRIDRFNLNSSADTGAAPSSSSLMGVRRVREGGATVTGGSSRAEDGGVEGNDAAGPPAKVARAERFREMIANSKGQRAQLQRDRVERDAATQQLDTEINSLLHLLPKRNKTEEEREAFLKSGTPEVRALLASYRRDHEAKYLSLKSSGTFEVRPLTEVARTATPDTTGTGKAERDPTAPAGGGVDDAVPSFLDEADRALLVRIRGGQARSREEVSSSRGIGADGAAEGPRVLPAPTTRKTAADVREAHATLQDNGGGPSFSAAADDFDMMMHAFQMDPRRAHAVERTPTVEEEAIREAQQERLREDRQRVPSLNLQERDHEQLTRGEWVAQGGDVAFQMHEEEAQEGLGDDNVDIPSSIEGDSEADDVVGDAAMDEDYVEADQEEEEDNEGRVTEKVGGSATLDRLMERLEQACLPGAEGGATRSKQLHVLLVQLHGYAAHHVLEVTKAFRLVLVEAERSFLRGTRRGGLRKTLLVYLYAITKIFPASDYRHAVVTPFLLFVCSALMQMKLESMEAVHSYLVLTILLLHCLKAGSGRFCAEVVVAALNVLALQLPRSVLEPARYQGPVLPMPLLERSEDILLNSSAPAPLDSAAETAQHLPLYQIGLLDTIFSPERLLLCAYHVLEEVCHLYRHTPAFPGMCAEPFLALDALLLRPYGPSSSKSVWSPSAAVRLAHESLAVRMRDVAEDVKRHRTPLAMRTFRPRPLRQFDPQLAEREANAVKSEIRLMKRDIREDKKRLMRHLSAEATVQRRAQEKRQTVDDAQREKRYHNVMSQLQQQQHSMNTVESLKARAKSKSRKGLSGAATTSASNEDAAE